MAVIELGLVTDGGERPANGGERRPLGRRDLRRVLVAVVAVFCVLTVTGSARPDPRGLPRLWSAPFREGADTFMLTADTVYVLAQPGGTRLSAYDARTGVLRWTTRSFADTTWLGSIRAGVLLMPAAYTTAQYQDQDGSEVSREFSRDTVAVDASTGRQLWRLPGEYSPVMGDRALLTEWNAEGSRVRTFRVVRLADGVTVWSRPAGDLETWVTDGMDRERSDRLVTVAAGGRVEVFDLAGGTRVTAATLPWAGQSPDDGYTGVTLDGHRLYVDHSAREQATVTAYDTETLRRLWRIAPAAPGGVYGCGPVLCLNAADETAGYDPETGALRWRIPGTANGFPLFDGKLLVDDDESGARHHLVDGATGRRLADLGAAVPVWNFAATGSPYLLARTREPAELMSVSRFDEDSGEVLLRGAIPPVLDYGCQSEGGLLACVTMDSRLTVTDVG